MPQRPLSDPETGRICERNQLPFGQLVSIRSLFPAAVSKVEQVGQPLVIDAEEGEQRGVEVIYPRPVHRRWITDIISLRVAGAASAGLTGPLTLAWLVHVW